MSRLQARWAVGALVVGALAIALFAGGREDEALPAAPKASSAASAPPRVDHGLDRLRRQAARSARRRDAAAVREVAGDPREETDARERHTAAFADDREWAEPVARRFLSAFARYELGDVSEPVVSELRATTTAAIAHQLLGSPPVRIPPGAAKPARATLIGLDFLAGESDGGRPTSTEFVATVDRGGDRTPLAISLRRVDGAWSVDGVGR